MVDEPEFLAKKLGVVLWLVPERGNGSEVGGGCDQRGPDGVAAAGGLSEQRCELGLLCGGYGGVLGQEQGLGSEDVGGWVAVGLRGCGCPCAGECQHGEECERQEEQTADVTARVRVG